MDFLTLAKTRCSVRDYEDTPVETEKLDMILEAGRIAPTACNKQPQRILVLQGEASMDTLGKAYNTFHAPLGLLVCVDTSDVWTRTYDGKQSIDIDASIMCDHMMLEATQLGLDSVWVCNFNPDILREAFHLAKHIEPVHLLLIGYGKNGTKKDPNRHDQERKKLSDILL